MTLVRGVVGAGLLAVIVASGAVLSQSAQRRSGTNLAPNGAYIEGLARGQMACQGQELLPADTAAVQLTVGTYGRPGPTLTATVTGKHGQTLTSGMLAEGWKEGVIRIPVMRVSEPIEETRFCVRNDGPQPIVLAGDAPDPGFDLQVAGRKIENQRVRVDYLRPGNESWLSLLPTLVHRFSLEKAGFVRTWAWLAVVALMVTAIAVAIRTVLRGDV